MTETIDIEMTHDQIRMMSDPEKLTVLVAIAIANRKELCRQGMVLEGNGKPGICEIVRMHSTQIKWMWLCFGGVAGFIVGTLAMHLNR